jgi:hypothetical protein
LVTSRSTSAKPKDRAATVLELSAANSAAQILHEHRERRSHATSCSTKSGAITPCPRRAPWTCTSPGSRRKSKRTDQYRGRSTATFMESQDTSSSGDVISLRPSTDSRAWRRSTATRRSRAGCRWPSHRGQSP